MSIYLNEAVDGFYILAFPLSKISDKWINIDIASGYPYTATFKDAHRFHSSKDAREYLQSFTKDFPDGEIVKINNVYIELEVVHNVKAMSDYQNDLAALNKRYGIES